MNKKISKFSGLGVKSTFCHTFGSVWITSSMTIWYFWNYCRHEHMVLLKYTLRSLVSSVDITPKSGHFSIFENKCLMLFPDYGKFNIFVKFSLKPQFSSCLKIFHVSVRLWFKILKTFLLFVSSRLRKVINPEQSYASCPKSLSNIITKFPIRCLQKNLPQTSAKIS